MQHDVSHRVREKFSRTARFSANIALHKLIFIGRIIMTETSVSSNRIKKYKTLKIDFF